MKKTLTILFYSLILISCDRNKYENKIIGEWFEMEEETKLEFNKGFLNILELSETKANWKANKKEIVYEFKNVFNDSTEIKSLNYELQNDTLFIKSDLSPSRKFKFIKAKNFTDLIFKKNNVDISLEVDKNAKLQRTENKYGIKIFVENKNGKIKAKTEYSNNLEDLENDLKQILNDLSPHFMNEYNDLHSDRFTVEQWVKLNIYYSIFADKEVPKSEINSIVEKLKKTEIKKVYRIYKTEYDGFMSFNKLKEIKL